MQTKTKSIKNQYFVESIDKFQCKEWLLHKHYAKRIPQISYSFGLYNGNKLLQGICTFGSPCRMLNNGFGCFEGKIKIRTLELNRLVINEGLGKNVLSYFVSKTLKKLPTPMVVVSYADSNNGHHGYIYQATNWIYTGITGKEKYYYDSRKNLIVHGRTIFSEFGTRSFDELPDYIKNAGVEEGKYRYFKLLGNRGQTKEMNNHFKYLIIQYPKGNNTRYDTSFSPTIQTQLF